MRARLGLAALLVLLSAPAAHAQWVRVAFPACTASLCAPTDGFFAGPGWAVADDDDRAYSGGGIEGAFVASTDGGATWTERRYTFDPISADRRVLTTVEGGTAYAWMQSAAGEGVHTSTDGLAWTLTGTPYASGGERYVGLRRHGGALVARSFSTAGRRLWRSADLGQTWTDVTGTLAGDRLSEVLGSAGGHLLVAVLEPTTGVARIWSTPDDGATWVRRDADFPVAGGSVLFGVYGGGGLARVGAATLVAYSATRMVGSAFVSTHLNRSVDGGATFAPVALPLLSNGREPGAVSSFAVVDAQTVFTHTNEAVFLSRDAGATWAKVDERAGTNNNGFVGTLHTDGRTLYYRNADYVERRPLADFGVTTAAERAAPTAGLALRLAGPNPARGHTAFRFAATGPATLAVFDALGREVARPFEGAAVGEALVSLDAAALVPGVYVARLTAGAGTATRPFVVAR